MTPKAPYQDTGIDNFMEAIKRVLDGPVVWVREKIVVPNQKQYNWYHKQYRRVPTVDQCYDQDYLCVWEADQQYLRDKLVDESILNIIRHRFEDCMLTERPDELERCQHLKESYTENMTNYHTKYGDMHPLRTARTAYMKQKHRMLWERRYGPVGTGMTPKNAAAEE